MDEEEYRRQIRERERRWKELADDYEEPPEIYVADAVPTSAQGSYDVAAPEIPDDGDDGQIHFEATPLQMKLGSIAASLAIFFFRFHWMPFFKSMARWCTRRAYWFSEGEIPVRSPSRHRDSDYLESRAYRGP